MLERCVESPNSCFILGRGGYASPFASLAAAATAARFTPAIDEELFRRLTRWVVFKAPKERE